MPLDWMDVRASGADSGEASGPEPVEPAPGVLEALNPEQERAVQHADGPLLILAGAGTGKTRVITRRIAWLVSTGRARPEEILAITFTNKAAGEMRDRVAQFFPVKGLWISTFHSMCARILRRDIEHLGGWTRDFSIYDTYERNQLLKGIVKDLGYDAQRFRPGMLGAWISDGKNRAWRRDGAFVPASGSPGGVEGEVLEKVRARYETALSENNALDFDDLLLKVLELFDAHPGVRDAYAARFRYVLVDEYQDTNHVQYRLARHLASWHANLAVCGDPDQSIYAWRGADIHNILDFERDFGVAEDRPVVTVKLERNYRSTECILGAAQGLIRNNLARKEKALWTERRSDARVHVLECADENDEAREVALQIQSLLARGRDAGQVAIFYRVNFMQRALERALRLAGLPYQIVGGVEFYERREVRDLVSYLRLLVNPRDDAACARVINVPARGIGEKSLAELAERARAAEVPLLAAVSSPDAALLLRGRAKKGVAAFAALMRDLAGDPGRPAAQVLESVIERTDYLRHLAEASDADSVAREENVEELLSHARTYDEENPTGGLRGFLEDVALVSDVDGLEEGGARVTLMTLHSSKGLEFPVVFVCGLEEGLLPHALALQEGGEEAGVEEERRLLYVGMTRAMDELFLTRAGLRLHYGETSWREPSRFLEELPSEFLEAEVEEERGPEIVYEPELEEVELRVGDRVEHDHFGYGVVEELRGSGPSTQVVVRFSSAGTRRLVLQYARLRVIRS
jgi:DNA helicase-2/ATP-dependent DNA helicase PcrA